MMYLLQIFTFALILKTIICINFCGDWTQYKDIKCVKVLEKKASEEETLTNCTHLEKSSTLVTIHSKDEQEFLNNILIKYNKISTNAWIGMKYTNTSYKWMDGTDTDFTNWSEESVRDGNDPCIEMSLTSGSLGKWTDVSCKRPALVVCQKKQDLSLNSLKDVIENLTQVFEKQHQELENRTNELGKKNKELEDEINLLKDISIPIGFLYTQLPNQSSPEQLWPKTNWTEVTQLYAGLFFRAEGSSSEPFNKIQQANQSRISNLNAWGFESNGQETKSSGITSMEMGKWSYRHDGYGLFNMGFFTTEGEVRPKNTAIKIWKRTQLK